MSAISRSVREVRGLFVEDASLTISVIGAVLIAALGFPRIGIPVSFRGALLFLVVILVLVENVTRSARSARPAAP